MIITELNEGEITLDDIERISENFLEDEDIIELVSSEHVKMFEDILQPTFAADENESEKRALFDRLLKELVVTNSKGEKLRFFKDEARNRLYFGSQEGFETIVELAKNEEPITASTRRF